MYLNARSLLNKFDAFSATVCELEPDIIGITENWAHSGVSDAEISLSGYTLFRADRPTDNKGGGVLLYVLSSLNSSAFVPRTKYPEHVWCKLNMTKNCELYVGVCYRSNNTEIFSNDLHSALRNLITEVSNKQVMLMGKISTSPT